MNWQELSTTSHYQTAIAVKDKLVAGDVKEATVGLEELIDAVGRSERRALRSQLIRLMAHVIKWKCQPERRSASWAVTIHQARVEIAESQEEVPSLTRPVVEAMWDKCLATAQRQAAEEINQEVQELDLSWEDVFEAEYTMLKPSRMRGVRRGKRKK